MAYVISDDCIACGTCIDECPVGAISEGDKYSINPEMCTDCGTCADAFAAKNRIFLCGKLLTHNGLFLSMSKTARYLFLFVLH